MTYWRQVILELCSNKEEIREEVEAKILDLAKRGIRALSVARGEPNLSGITFVKQRFESLMVLM